MGRGGEGKVPQYEQSIVRKSLISQELGRCRAGGGWDFKDDNESNVMKAWEREHTLGDSQDGRVPGGERSSLYHNSPIDAACDQMRPQISPSNHGTMSSKETEWLEQRVGYSLETEGGTAAEVGRGENEG
ncbi:hypothetical protein EYF80_014538 [Liparis tanakae]|uniref:Uncharacterized protein n=1 Tax=Liparis tanakae TaxID=230148 RepID=A0A4Z2IC64_9TELE|nr:hypothetical protein EYF80_014538 [Liparis tanakae]